MKRTNFGLLAIGLTAFLFGPSSAVAAVTLGSTVKSFAVLAGSTVTNTGSSVITGNVGVHAGTAVTGFFPPGIVVGGTIHSADGVALQAQNELTTAFVAAQSPITNPCPALNNLTGIDLGTLTLTPGVYCFSSSAQLTGTLTLDLQGDPNAFFLFQIGSTLTTASASSVVLINTGVVPPATCAPNLFWQVDTATFGTTTQFVGNVLAQTSITLTTGATLIGRALARIGAVTLDTNTVNISACGAAVVCPPITLSPATLPPMGAGTPFSVLISVAGGPGPYAFAITAGALPAGLALTGATSTSVNITGTPTTPGPFSFQITATDTLNPTCFATITYSGVVGPAGVPPGGSANAGGPTLDSFGLAILLVLLAVAGVFAVNRFSS